MFYISRMPSFVGNRSKAMCNRLKTTEAGQLVTAEEAVQQEDKASGHMWYINYHVELPIDKWFEWHGSGSDK